MNMKKTYVNLRFLLLTTIYSVFCIAIIWNFIVLNIITYNDFEKTDFEKIVTLPHYTTTLSNKSLYAKPLQPKGNQPPTLSRGYTEDLNKNYAEYIDFNYDEELYTLNESEMLDSYFIKKPNINLAFIMTKDNQVINAHLPDYLMYKNVNITNLKDFLNLKNSLLVEEPYFSTIISVSKDFNLNPLVMFAITGQEQSFVPKDDENAYMIANNPYNVFHSWKKYNTNIQDATSIAARTVVNLCKNRPSNIDAFTWVNRKYSEDKNWSKAIRSLFNQLEGNVAYWK